MNDNASETGNYLVQNDYKDVKNKILHLAEGKITLTYQNNERRQKRG